MRVRFLGTMPVAGYSGGRLLALTMAESLAMTGETVDFLVNNIPEMYDEFKSFSRLNLIKADFDNLSPWVDRSIDIVIIIPGQGHIFKHGEWTRHAIECHAKIVLLNFEPPNWFNKVSPYKRDEESWAGWDIVSKYADLILSISQEGNKYAKKYYKSTKEKCKFDFCYPGINTVLADQAPSTRQRQKQIVMLTRIDPHKGFDILEPLVTPKLAGYHVVIHLGTGEFPSSKLRKLRRKFSQLNMKFEIKSAIVGVDKFTLLKQSSLLYFPTRFEGFGIPPLEAAYCLLPCACSNLPVLKEFGKKAFTYGDPNDIKDMRRAVIKALTSQNRLRKEHRRISKIAKMQEYGKRQVKIFKSLFR